MVKQKKDSNNKHIRDISAEYVPGGSHYQKYQQNLSGEYGRTLTEPNEMPHSSRLLIENPSSGRIIQTEMSPEGYRSKSNDNKPSPTQ